MLIMSTLARQIGKPLMIFNTTWTTPAGKQKATMLALVLGVMDDANIWHPTTESEDTMNRFNDLLPTNWPYTVLVSPAGRDGRIALEEALCKTPKECGALLVASTVQDYKSLHAALNIQGGRLV